jgi:hypothetical protein
MSKPSQGTSDTLAPELAERLDGVCDRFEAAWKAARVSGPRPRIEDYLDDPPDVGGSAFPPSMRTGWRPYFNQRRHLLSRP